jgi:hypothetical protein
MASSHAERKGPADEAVLRWSSSSSTNTATGNPSFTPGPSGILPGGVGGRRRWSGKVAAGLGRAAAVSLAAGTRPELACRGLPTRSWSCSPPDGPPWFADDDDGYGILQDKHRTR